MNQLGVDGESSPDAGAAKKKKVAVDLDSKECPSISPAEHLLMLQ